MTTEQLEQIFNEILEYQMDNVPLAKTTAVYKLAEKGLSMLTPPIDNKAVEEWISVEDRLPDVSEKYGESDYLLCIDEHNNQEFVGWYSNKYGWKVAHYMAISSEVKVTHWQPLPKKPKTLPSNHQQSNPPK